MARLFMQGLINGENGTFHAFGNHRDPQRVRTYNAVPINPQSANFDQQAEVKEVFHLLFGSQHAPPDVGNLQVNIVVLNLKGGPWGPGAGGPFCAFELWEAEA
jgi:hypothetical protein